ncbi:chalcone isomerase family protein [Alicycliphilus denitrificans]|uniref:chalcone isomerase family protein n=1 Tax=Alicycliphilus denitrificans TaxID=179636 RepID=UPI00384E4B62
MPWSQFSYVKRWAVAAGAAVALAAAAGHPALARDGSAPPPWLHQALPGAALAGEGQLRFFGLRIYDARLWVTPGFDASRFGAHALALELTYHRAFSGAAIAQRSVEEMQRQAPLEPAQAERWQQRLAALLPDVQPGDRLIGLYQPGQGMHLWRGSQALGTIDDAALARLFFGIWLSPRTSEPGLRSALLARSPGGAAP